ncbi:energy transducer TonB [Flavobacterium sp.]|jgi:protein TonB|uniref:energy transducer TonB n=1 Tax=Flavobacterium sp. TaxID=239 RepID=UPI0038FCB0FC
MKLDLFRTQWLDLVFDGRNKKYGAYELRKENPKTSVKALLGGAFIFAFALSTPLLLDLLPDSEAKNTLDEKVVLVNLDKPKEKLPEPIKPPEPPKPKIDEVKFVAPKVVAKEKVVEEIKTIEELKDKTIAAKDQKGDKDAAIVIDQPTGNADKDAEIIDNNVYSSAGIEVQPEFPGGWAKFGQYVQRNYRSPEVEQDLKGRVFVEFVVEKDGSLTDIKVVRDLGFGTGAEAIRMLKNAPRFKPGVQNGKTIRVRYSLPIMLDIKTE